jgi:hypothetical protein
MKNVYQLLLNSLRWMSHRHSISWPYSPPTCQCRSHQPHQTWQRAAKHKCSLWYVDHAQHCHQIHQSLCIDTLKWIWGFQVSYRRRPCQVLKVLQHTNSHLAT